MSKKPIKIPKKEQSEKESIQELRSRNRKLEKENKRLKGELRTLEASMSKTVEYLRDDLKDIPLAKLIKGVNSGDSKKTIKEANTPLDEDKREEVRQKWANWRKKISTPST